MCRPSVCWLVRWCWRFDVMHGSLHLTLSVRFPLVYLSHLLSYTYSRAQRSFALSLSPVRNLTGAHEKPKCRKIDTVLPCRKFSGEISAVPTAAAASATVFAPLYSLYTIHKRRKTVCDCVCIWPILW